MSPSSQQILEWLTERQLLCPGEAADWRSRFREDPDLQRPEKLFAELVEAGRLTQFQAKTIYHGRRDTLFVGEYVLIERLGVGAMGQVFKARHQGQQHWAALKILRPDRAQSPRHLERFCRERSTSSGLSHPNIVAVYATGEDAGRQYLAMEYVDGPNLDDHLSEFGPMPVGVAIGAALQAAQGLAYAHGLGVVHRDVKPSNLLLTTSGVVKILDLGIARRLSLAEQPSSRLTQSGQILGTPHYLAPEQALDPKNAGPQADIYALGCTLYRMLTGETPYQGESDYDVLMAHVRSPIPRVTAIRNDAPANVDIVCRRMLAKLPEERYGSMDEVIDALRHCQWTSSGDAVRIACTEAFAPPKQTVMASHDQPRQRARWRMPEEDLSERDDSSIPPSPPRSHKASTHSVFSSLTMRQLQQLRTAGARLARRRGRDAPLATRRQFWQALAAVAAAAVLVIAGLGFASRVQRTGWVVVDVYPAQSIVEIVDETRKVRVRRRVEEGFSLSFAPGRYWITVTKEGFVPYAREIMLQSGQRTKVYAALERN